MREYITILLAFVAIIIFVIAIISGFLMRPDSDIESDIIDENQLKEGSITGAKITDGTITDQDISETGISKIADNSITMEHLNTAIMDALMGLTNLTVVEFQDAEQNSIDGSYILDNTITDAKISDLGISKIADDAITSDQIKDNSISLDDLSSSIADMLSNMASSENIFEGEVTVAKISYLTPRTHYFSVGGEHFQPLTTVDYASGGGCGGAYLISGEGKLVAPVNLPDGAIVTSFKAYFYDRSSDDMDVYFKAQDLDACSYIELAHVQSNKNTGHYSLESDIVATNSVIDNQHYAYHLLAESNDWSSSLKIKGAVIGYTIDEVE